MTLFPSYRLAGYQASYGPRAEYFMGASAPESLSVRELLSLANQTERRQWDRLGLGYSSSQGDPALRDSIADLYPGLTSADIITFAGAQEAIFVAYHALLKKNDRVQVILPIYEPLALVAQGIGAKIGTVSMENSQAGEWRMDLQTWRESVHQSTSMAVINFPHNPTGKLIRHQELEQIVEHCASNDCWLFSDEVFRGLEYRRSEQLTPVAAIYEKGISLGVMSKAFGLGGVRIGWIACRDKVLIKRMLEIKSYLSICNGRTDELLATIALRHAPRLLDNTRKLIQQNLQSLRAACSDHSDVVHWHQPDAGCVAYPKLTDGVDARDFALRLLDQTGVMIIPGHCFIRGEAHFRIGFGRRDFPLALKRFSNHLDSFRT